MKHRAWYWFCPLSSSPRISARNIFTSCLKSATKVMSVPSPCLNSSDIESLSLSASKTSSVTNPSESRTRTRSSEPSPRATSSTRAQRRLSIRPEAALMQLATIPKHAKLNPTEEKIEAKSKSLRSYPLTLLFDFPESLFLHTQGIAYRSLFHMVPCVPALSRITNTVMEIRLHRNGNPP